MGAVTRNVKALLRTLGYLIDRHNLLRDSYSIQILQHRPQGHHKANVGQLLQIIARHLLEATTLPAGLIWTPELTVPTHLLTRDRSKSTDHPLERLMHQLMFRTHRFDNKPHQPPKDAKLVPHEAQQPSPIAALSHQHPAFPNPLPFDKCRVATPGPSVQTAKPKPQATPGHDFPLALDLRAAPPSQTSRHSMDWHRHILLPTNTHPQLLAPRCSGDRSTELIARTRHHHRLRHQRMPGISLGRATPLSVDIVIIPPNHRLVSCPRRRTDNHYRLCRRMSRLTVTALSNLVKR